MRVDLTAVLLSKLSPRRFANRMIFLAITNTTGKEKTLPESISIGLQVVAPQVGLEPFGYSGHESCHV